MNDRVTHVTFIGYFTAPGDVRATRRREMTMQNRKYLLLTVLTAALLSINCGRRQRAAPDAAHPGSSQPDQPAPATRPARSNGPATSLGVDAYGRFEVPLPDGAKWVSTTGADLLSPGSEIPEYHIEKPAAEVLTFFGTALQKDGWEKVQLRDQRRQARDAVVAFSRAVPGKGTVTLFVMMGHSSQGASNFSLKLVGSPL